MKIKYYVKNGEDKFVGMKDEKVYQEKVNFIYEHLESTIKAALPLIKKVKYVVGVDEYQTVKDEYLYIFYGDDAEKEQRINITGDSPIAIIKDVIRRL